MIGTRLPTRCIGTRSAWTTVTPIHWHRHLRKIASSISGRREKLKIDFPKLSGREAIVNALIPFFGPLDTSHTVSNLQIEVSDDSATLYAYVMAQHFMPREGCRPGSENALLMNRYDCELVRDGQKWRFKRVTIDNAWAQGNPEILNALAIRRALAAKSRQSK
jgi:hypothetical protein